jgi:ribosome-binding protein aMBF1 (putative translation factor)
MKDKEELKLGDGIIAQIEKNGNVVNYKPTDFDNPEEVKEFNRIKEVLEEKGIKQTWLAEKLEKSYNMLNSYVQNRRQPSIEDLHRIAEILDEDVRNLLVGNKNL